MPSPSPNFKAASKFLSLVLRHRPDKIDITLDEHGWIDVDILIAAANKHGMPLDRDTLDEIVRTNDKQRFALSEDGSQIRANQGHSIDIDLGLQPQQPPEFLYHGTAENSIPSIRKDGLLPRSRQHVHLSPDLETATKVGARHGRPVVLEVEAGKMWRDGHVFYCSENGVWLTGTVPADCIRFPERPE